jgi:hypothetical protein
MVAADHIEECGYTDLAMPMLDRLFPGASADDLAAMLEQPRPGHVVFANVEFEFAPPSPPGRVGRVEGMTRIELDQTATDNAIEYDIKRFVALDLASRERLDRAFGARHAQQMGTVFVGNRQRSVPLQLDGRHSSPVIRAWAARLEAAKREIARRNGFTPVEAERRLAADGRGEYVRDPRARLYSDDL